MPQLCVFDTPCVFENIDDARKAIDNADFQKEIQKIYKGAGYDLLGIADQCFRVMTSAKPFTGIESFKGQKIRTMENAYHLQFWKQMGANPTPMSFSEVYIGLQQGNNRCPGECLRDYRKCKTLRTAKFNQYQCRT